MIDRHVSHEKDETHPWHEGSVDILGDDISPGGAYEKRANAAPKIEEPNKVKQGDPRLGSDNLRETIEHTGVRYYEKILLVGFGIRDPLQNSSEWVGYQEGSDEFHC